MENFSLDAPNLVLNSAAKPNRETEREMVPTKTDLQAYPIVLKRMSDFSVSLRNFARRNAAKIVEKIPRQSRLK